MTFFSISRLRLATGFAQGLVLYLLYKALDQNLWPATEGIIFAPLVLVGAIVPTLIIISLGNMRARTLLKWMLTVTAMLIGLGIHDIVRRSTAENAQNWNEIHFHYNALPSITFVFFISAGLFIAQSLITAADTENRRIASYPRYFDVAWKLAVQAIFSSIFVGIFWLILWMGAGMFKLIQIDFFEELIRHEWFFIPATTMAYAYAIHVTDVRVNLVRGIRALKLSLLSWLLPIMALFVAGFIVSLPFKGVRLLWATHHTSQLLLGAAAWLILLVNAAYQDGLPEHIPAKILRYSGTLGAVLLTPLVAIAIYALFLRVSEYGWTVHIIGVFSCLLVVGFHAVGYLWAALVPGPWLKRLERTNIYGAFVTLAVLLALFTPLADPARLSVADQMSRLENGLVSADKFDYFYLKYQGEGYGADALNRLKAEASGSNAAVIKQKVDAALASTNQWQAQQTPPKPEEITKNITVYPQGKTLPENFAKQNWGANPKDRWTLPQCLFNNTVKCEAFIIPPAQDTPQQIILVTGNLAPLFRADEKGWALVGFLQQINCKGVENALKDGKFKFVPSTEQVLEINGMHLQIRQNEDCP